MSKKKDADSVKLKRSSKQIDTSGSEAEDSDERPSNTHYFDSEDSNEEVDTDSKKKKAKRMIKRRKKEKDDSQSDASDKEKISIIKNRSKIFEFLQSNIIDWSAKQDRSFPGMKKKMLDNFYQGSNEPQTSPIESKLSIKVEDNASGSPAIKPENASNEPSPTENSGGKKRRSLKLKKKGAVDEEEQHFPEGNISDFNFLNTLTSPTGTSNSTVGEPDSATSASSIMSLKIPRKKKQPATIVSENSTGNEHSNSNSLLDNSPVTTTTPSSMVTASATTPISATGISSSFGSPNVGSSMIPPPPQQPPPPFVPPPTTGTSNPTSQPSQQAPTPSFLPPNANILPNAYGSSSANSSNFPTLHSQQTMSYHMHPHQTSHNLPPPPPQHGYPSHQQHGSLAYGNTSHGQNWQSHLPYINQQQQQPQPPPYPAVQDPRRR